MSPLWMIPIQLFIIVGGVVAALIVGPARAVGRHRLNRRLRDEEMVELEAWLAQMWEAGDFGTYMAASRARKRDAHAAAGQAAADAVDLDSLLENNPPRWYDHEDQ